MEDRENLKERDANAQCSISHMQNQEPIYLILHATRIHSTPPGQLLVVRSERRQTEARDLVALGDD